MNRKKQSLRGIKKFALRIVTTALAVLPIAASTCVDSHTVENALREPVNSYEWKLQDQKYNRDVADALPPKYYFFFKQYKDDLVRFGQQYGVAPELVMGFVVEENRTRSLFQDIADVVVSLPLVYQIADPSLGVGQIKKQPVVIEANGTDCIGIRNMGWICLSFDHRLIDGATADIFMADLKNTLETWSTVP